MCVVAPEGIIGVSSFVAEMSTFGHKNVAHEPPIYESFYGCVTANGVTAGETPLGPGREAGPVGAARAGFDLEAGSQGEDLDSGSSSCVRLKFLYFNCAGESGKQTRANIPNRPGNIFILPTPFFWAGRER